MIDSAQPESVRKLVDRFFPDLETRLRKESVSPDSKESRPPTFQNQSVLAALNSAWGGSDLELRFTKSVERLGMR